MHIRSEYKSILGKIVSEIEYEYFKDVVLFQYYFIFYASYSLTFRLERAIFLSPDRARRIFPFGVQSSLAC